MDASVRRPQTNRRQLQQIIAELSEGVILFEPDQSIRWANQAALKMHGVSSIEALGQTVSEYRERFQLGYRTIAGWKREITHWTGGAGGSFSDVLVEFAQADEPESMWVHRVRSLVITDENGAPDCRVLFCMMQRNGRAPRNVVNSNRPTLTV